MSNRIMKHLSLHEVMTLASIVEAEAKLPQERDTIASVYLNRLRIGMKLDADPSVQYGLHLNHPLRMTIYSRTTHIILT